MYTRILKKQPTMKIMFQIFLEINQ